MKYIKLSLLLCTLFCSCSQKKAAEKESANLMEIIVNPKDAVSVYLEDISDEQYQVTLHDTPTAKLAHIVNFFATDSLFIISDHAQNTVFIFNKHGQLIRTINRMGKEPGDYATMTDVLYDPNTREIEVLDMLQNKILRYKLNGDFIKAIPIKNEKYWGISFAKAKNTYAFQISNTNAERRRVAIYKDDVKELNFHYNKLVLPAILKNVNIKLLNQFDIFQDSIYYMPLMDDKIYNVSLEAVKPVYKIVIPEANKMTPEALEKESAKDFIEYWKKMDSMNVVYDNHSLYITDRFVSFGFSFQSRSKYQNVFYSKKTGKLLQFLELKSRKNPDLKIHNRILGKLGDYFIIRTKSFIYDSTPKATVEQLAKEDEKLLFFKLKDF